MAAVADPKWSATFWRKMPGAYWNGMLGKHKDKGHGHQYIKESFFR
jgi:hypothetical protein